MPRITAEQKERNHRRIVDAASRRFRAEGIDAVGIDELMKGAGMTHGGFYNHFDSKEALAEKVCDEAFSQSHALLARENETGVDGGGAPLSRVLDEYLSAKHRDALDGGCPSASLVIDAGRHGRAVQDSYAAGVEGYLAGFIDALSQEAVESGDSPDPDLLREEAITLLGQIVGAMVLSRAVRQARPELSDEILGATRRRVP